MVGRNLYRNIGYIYSPSAVYRISPVSHLNSDHLFLRESHETTSIMKLIIAFAAVVAVALALPLSPNYQINQPVVVKETPLDNIGIDGYQFGYELSNGQAHQESAQLVNVGHENESIAVRGSYTYVDPETNVRYTVNYIADENGFRPEGAHLPAV
nr:PREDICTED: flexible cuticle protein 12-like [Linepithema humile]